MMVCFDGSHAANYALHVAKKRALKLGAKLLLVTSMTGGRDVVTKDYEMFENLLARAKSGVVEKNIPCKTLLSVRNLTTGENLSRIAKERDIDEMYIGIEKRSKVGKFIFGSTAQYVILNAPCPVVTVRSLP